ncbi:DegT/DnrJ/EryC1/StrS family aminotransferase [Calderihabitans maritimus]|uniref:Cell wall biogenesis regulatory protein n=3 Tax=Calderihabitans maritimus TaxID=1246530 RepID=A0A1Z5HX99_9FIRM|nr:DegT/DnrJ/EryC1/StrS family aminotransferase [Calderihabitans maritimus]GAW93987.1 cell wall biogenesis regulatory protein [Calderihabitans maritimus]
MRIPLSGPDITEREIELVNEVLRSRWLSMGPKVKEFEEKMAAYVGRRFAVAVNSGTSGLHLLVRSLGIGEGDEVITTPFSFVASANCILYERARPVFVDIDPLTLNIDVDRIEEKITERTRAILPVHVFGQPVDMERVREIAQKHGLAVIEDACEAIGAEYRGRKAGAQGDGAVFAFYPNKQMTTGEGGVIVTDDEEIAKLCRSMRNQGRGEDGAWLCHERLGFNYRMDELSAALGIAQLERIEELLAKREKVARMYNERLREIEGVKVPYVAPEVNRMSWFVYVIRLEEGIDRDKVMEYLTAHGVGSRPYFTPIHLQPFYVEQFGYKEGDFPVTERVAKSTIALPFYNNLTEEQVDYVVKTLERALATF